MQIINQDIRIQYAADKRCFVHIIIKNNIILNNVTYIVKSAVRINIFHHERSFTVLPAFFTF